MPDNIYHLGIFLSLGNKSYGYYKLQKSLPISLLTILNKKLTRKCFFLDKRYIGRCAADALEFSCSE